MKTAKANIRLLVFGFCLAAAMYNCKTKDVESLTPFTYTFKGFDDVKLPEVKPTAPAAVSVTASSVTASTAAAALTAGLSSIGSTGQIPAVVQQAGADISKAVPDQQASQMAAAFTPDVVKNLTTNGTLPDALKAQVMALAADPALKAYLPTFTFPTVNGKAVTGRVGAGGVVVPLAIANATLDDDACKAAANAAYTAAVASLDASRLAQTTPVNAQYTQAQATIQADATSCKSGIPATYAGYRSLALQQLNQQLAVLAGANLPTTLNEQLLLLIYTAYFNAVTNFTTLEVADSRACDSVAAQKLANAQTARDGDLSTINGNYNAALATLTTARDRAVASCHNQGGGRIGAE